MQGRAGDTVVKLRPVDPDDLPEEMRRSPSVNVEVDAMPGGYVCSASLKGRADAATILETALGKASIRKLFSKEQRAFFEAHAPEGLTMKDLSTLGPIFVLKLNFQPKELPRRMVAGSSGSTPTARGSSSCRRNARRRDAFQVAAEARLFLTEKGVSLQGKQETKTKAALTFFSKQLQAAPAAAS